MISYEPLFRTMKEKRGHIVPVAKDGFQSCHYYAMKCGKSVSTNTIDLLCRLLHCHVEDIMQTYRKKKTKIHDRVDFRLFNYGLAYTKTQRDTHHLLKNTFRTNYCFNHVSKLSSEILPDWHASRKRFASATQALNFSLVIVPYRIPALCVL